MRQTAFRNGYWLIAALGLFCIFMATVLFAATPTLSVAIIISGAGVICCLFPIFHNYRRQSAENETVDSMLKSIQIGLSVFDERLDLIKWNSVFADLMEHDERDLRQKPNFRDLLSENYDKYAEVGDDKEEFVNTAIGYVKERPFGQADRYFKNGKIVELTYNALPDGSGFVTTASDVTSIRLAEKAMQESEIRFRRMVEMFPDAIIAHKDGFIVYVNNSAVKLLKAKEHHDLIGKQISSFFPERDMDQLAELFGASEHMQIGQSLPSIKSAIISGDGVYINVALDGSALLYGDTKILQLVIRDISAQVQIEEFLEHAKEEAEYASQLKGTFLANMSHELRTPLNAVIGFSEVIKKQMFGPVGSEKYLEYAEDIRASGSHLLELINNILDFSKIESGEQDINEEDIEIDILVSECVRLTQQRAIENDINIKLEFDPLLPQIFGDRRMLKQILINLLSNAIKFTPTGGKIVTTVKVPESEGLKITVRDNGIGIKEDDIEKALTPFVQIDSENSRKYEGTGLGLPLSKNLAEMHDGSLELKSQLGKGTVVSLTLPKSRIRQEAA